MTGLDVKSVVGSMEALLSVAISRAVRTSSIWSESSNFGSSQNRVESVLRVILDWYFSRIYGRLEGPNALPFYCDAARVGHFAVKPAALAAGDAPTLFRLFVLLAMFQARRDVVIMRQQATMPRERAQYLLSPSVIGRLALRSHCDLFASPESFDAGCRVQKEGGLVDCSYRPGAPCHVKDATVLLNRMGDMGKLPTSAWLHAWKGGRLKRLLMQVITNESDPQMRAVSLVKHFSQVHRVGVKLATMFVSALSTPALAPDLTPWFPAIDGNALVVVDTNVARAVDMLRDCEAVATYEARANWLREQARSLDLREFASNVPRYSPRLVQQALYSFCSKSNRQANGNDCRDEGSACRQCIPGLCPFK